MMDHRLGRRAPTKTLVRLHFGGGTCARGLGCQHRPRRYVRGVVRSTGSPRSGGPRPGCTKVWTAPVSGRLAACLDFVTRSFPGVVARLVTVVTEWSGRRRVQVVDAARPASAVESARVRQDILPPINIEYIDIYSQ